MNWEIGTDTAFLILRVKEIADENLLHNTGKPTKPCGDLDGKGTQTRGAVGVCVADSLCCPAEMNTTL